MILFRYFVLASAFGLWGISMIGIFTQEKLCERLGAAWMALTVGGLLYLFMK